MLYQKRTDAFLSREDFKKPSCEYRGMPFWAWNTRLDSAVLLRQAEIFREMGFGGFFMHSRIGLDTPYLGEDFFKAVNDCIDWAKQNQMYAGLYDEDLWPSGYCAGKVTQNHPEYRKKKLVWSAAALPGAVTREEFDKNGGILLLGSYRIRLDAQGYLLQSDWQCAGKQPFVEKSTEKGSEVQLFVEKGTEKDAGRQSFEPEDVPETAGTERQLSGAESIIMRYAYLVTQEQEPDYCKPVYADTLNADAVKCFLETTHEVYRKETGAEFGKTAFSVFTDEPAFADKENLMDAQDDRGRSIPWTTDFADTFYEAYGFDILKSLPELFYERADRKLSYARYCYHDHVAARFEKAYFQTIGDWCRENGILFTGHVLYEDTLTLQNRMTGDAMRMYPHFDIPGMDLLFDSAEFNTAKQVQSIVHQYGKEGMMSELYGVTDWDFDFRGHKFQGDWQAALGVTLRVPHLSWVSMEGPAKRDYPASIQYQSPWYQEYSCIEDHFARVCSAMTRGVPVVKIGVIHPMESYWVLFGPEKATSLARKILDEKFRNLADWLLKAHLDFDYLSEALLPEQYRETKEGFQVGKMNYSVVLVPDCIILRASTVVCLETFRKSGGRVIFAGECPKCFDSQGQERLNLLYEQSKKVAFEKEEIRKSLEPDRVLSISSQMQEKGTSDGLMAEEESLLYQLRRDGSGMWLFLAHGEKVPDGLREISIRLPGDWMPYLYDTQTGEKKEWPQEGVAYADESNDAESNVEKSNEEEKHAKGENAQASGVKRYTRIKTALFAQDSLLIRLEEIKALEPGSPVRISLQEENVLLLDTAEYSLDGSEYRERKNVLAIDDEVRQMLGYPVRSNYDRAQPWQWKENDNGSHRLSLRYRIESHIPVHGAFLALERPEECEIKWNGCPVPAQDSGWYVDEAIRKIPLPEIKEGTHCLEVTIPIVYSNIKGAEAMYLLGDFGVELQGENAVICRKPEIFEISSLTEQKLPFYSGNVGYKIDIDVYPDKELQTGRRQSEFPIGNLRISVKGFKGSCVRVFMDGADYGLCYKDPYEIRIGSVAAGVHHFTFLLYGNRYNTFGALHFSRAAEKIGALPAMWNPKGADYRKEYQLRPFGILSEPVFYFNCF